MALLEYLHKKEVQHGQKLLDPWSSLGQEIGKNLTVMYPTTSTPTTPIRDLGGHSYSIRISRVVFQLSLTSQFLSYHWSLDIVLNMKAMNTCVIKLFWLNNACHFNSCAKSTQMQLRCANTWTNAGIKVKKCENFPYILIKSSESRTFCTSELLLFTVCTVQLFSTNSYIT